MSDRFKISHSCLRMRRFARKQFLGGTKLKGKAMGFLVLIWIASMFAGVSIAKSKNHSAFGGFMWAFLLGPLGVLVVGLHSKTEAVHPQAMQPSVTPESAAGKVLGWYEVEKEKRL